MVTVRGNTHHDRVSDVPSAGLYIRPYPERSGCDVMHP